MANHNDMKIPIILTPELRDQIKEAVTQAVMPGFNKMDKHFSDTSKQLSDIKSDLDQTTETLTGIRGEMKVFSGETMTSLNQILQAVEERAAKLSLLDAPESIRPVTRQSPKDYNQK